MDPINFKGSNKELRKPESMTDEECSSLHTFNNWRESISCWRPSWREVLQIIFTRRIWLTVLSGRSQPPVKLQAGISVQLTEQVCRECGCHKGNPCISQTSASTDLHCRWVEADLCSVCYDKQLAKLHNCMTCGKAITATHIDLDGYECSENGSTKHSVYVAAGEYNNCPDWEPEED